MELGFFDTRTYIITMKKILLIISFIIYLYKFII